ncbi:host-nuclease inhibitor Gam family protein, partial [Escherichia coli]|uniref:host-nuclease inhibitor Gam family protein n=2 Tax=Escherichia coli TaxID=562 RepID=UPI0020CD6BDA
MNAYYIQDRLEAQSWTRHYQQIAREEKEAELADDMGKGLPQHLFESLCIDHLQRHGASKKAITLNRPGFPGECFICELRLPDHRFRWKHNKLFL